jgi:hypothetical protein
VLLDSAFYLFVHFAVLVNSNLMGFFSSSHDLREGDPLSPLVFIIIIKALSRMISAMVNGGLFSGFSVGSKNVGALNISYLCL